MQKDPSIPTSHTGTEASFIMEWWVFLKPIKVCENWEHAAPFGSKRATYRNLRSIFKGIYVPKDSGSYLIGIREAAKYLAHIDFNGNYILGISENPMAPICS